MGVTGPGCGRKGDPIPRARVQPGPCLVTLRDLRHLSVRLPDKDLRGAPLAGLERVRIFYAPLTASRPDSAQIVARKEIVFERSRPDLPGPGEILELDLSKLEKAPGWIVVVAVRVGEVLGVPADPVPWMDPALR